MVEKNQHIITQVKTWQSQGLRVGLATGVFDLLHIEHLRFLTKAKALGDKLIVGVETDNRVAQMKGNHRPINRLIIRLEQLEALKAVDMSFSLPSLFDTQSAWVTFMQTLKPDYYAVSSHSNFIKNKQTICRQTNVAFYIVHPHNPKISTTQLLDGSPAAEEPEPQVAPEEKEE